MRRFRSTIFVGLVTLMSCGGSRHLPITEADSPHIPTDGKILTRVMPTVEPMLPLTILADGRAIRVKLNSGKCAKSFIQVSRASPRFEDTNWGRVERSGDNVCPTSMDSDSGWAVFTDEPATRSGMVTGEFKMYAMSMAGDRAELLLKSEFDDDKNAYPSPRLQPSTQLGYVALALGRKNLHADVILVNIPTGETQVVVERAFFARISWPWVYAIREREFKSNLVRYNILSRRLQVLNFQTVREIAVSDNSMMTTFQDRVEIRDLDTGRLLRRTHMVNPQPPVDVDSGFVTSDDRGNYYFSSDGSEIISLGARKAVGAERFNWISGGGRWIMWQDMPRPTDPRQFIRYDGVGLPFVVRMASVGEIRLNSAFPELSQG